jgi:hypothetical protein
MTKLSYFTLTWAMLPALCVWSQDQPYISAKKLFYAAAPVTPAARGPRTRGKDTKNGSGPVVVPTAVSAPALRYSLLQETQPGKEVAVEPSREFHSGDRVRFEFESNRDGYLYVIQQGSSGAWNVLFPDTRINNGTNQVHARTAYSVPAPPKYFVFNNVAGDEKVMVFLCKSPLRGLPADARGLPQSVDQNIINELNSSVPSRDLVFEKDEEPTHATVVPTAATVTTSNSSTYVVNKNENGEAVVATISLKHVQ